MASESEIRTKSWSLQLLPVVQDELNEEWLGTYWALRCVMQVQYTEVSKGIKKYLGG